ncbi:rCG63433 [Rattus norvegicus]|uniref:RCG63433 n=1 Tax=Rattus norvegicus TaxID=10116 RepID=A6HUH4_RAT|nr:rCG63433 [Rattus norvegicus]
MWESLKKNAMASPRLKVRMCVQPGGVHTFKPSTWESGRRISEFKVSLFYRTSSRTARDLQKVGL